MLGIEPTAQDVCESLTGDDCGEQEIQIPEWLAVDATTVLVGPRLVGLIYEDNDGELAEHRFDPDTAPALFGGPGALIAVGPSIRVTDLGIED